MKFNYKGRRDGITYSSIIPLIQNEKPTENCVNYDIFPYAEEIFFIIIILQ